jgi:two-component system, OmpR family, response regulator MprA
MMVTGGMEGRIRHPPVLQGEAAHHDGLLRFGDLTMDIQTRDVHRGQRAMYLTPTEFRLMELFLRNPRQVLTREVIFDRVWGFDVGRASNTLNVYIGYLRRKTEAGGEHRVIHTARSIGFILRD